MLRPLGCGHGEWAVGVASTTRSRRTGPSLSRVKINVTGKDTPLHGYDTNRSPGAVVIARYGQTSRGIKAMLAEERVMHHGLVIARKVFCSVGSEPFAVLS